MKKFILFLGVLFLFACSEDEVAENVKVKEEGKKTTEEVITKTKVSGFVEKGPFVSGSTLTANELKKDLSKTGKTFTTPLKNDEGFFELENLKLISPYMQFSVDGFFLNEMTGKLSTAKITLYAISNVKDRASVNVNLLTHIQKSRVEKLIKEGKTFEQAKKQSLIEIGKSFYLKESQLKFKSEDIKLIGTKESSKILLAISAIFLEGKTEAELTQFLAQYSDDLADNGVIDKAAIKKSISESSYRLHRLNKNLKIPVEYIREHIKAYYKKLGKTVTIADFAKYIDHDKDGDLENYHSITADVAVESELEKAPKLTFTKLTINKKDVSKEELLKQIKEKEKEGFTIKNITISNDSFADVNRDNFSLTLKKAGTFTIRLILTKKGFEDPIIEATIEYLLSETLGFNKFSTSKSTITKTDILNAVTGKKGGFTIKSIVVKDNAFADVKGTAPNLFLTLKKVGDFTATIVLQKSNYADVTLTASFSGVPQKLTFNKLTTFKTTITKTELLAQIPETEKAGYNLKSIVINQSGFATVGEDLSLTILKTGDFTANITLQKTGYFDTVINNAAFTKGNLLFVFDKNTRTITGVTSSLGKTYLATAIEVTFPDQIDGVNVEEIKGTTNNSIFGNNIGNLNRTIKTIHLSKNLKTIGKSAFSYCTALTSITIPDSVTSIGDSVFSDCTALTSITIPDSVTSIGQAAFSGCTALTSINIPDSITSIGIGVFSGCTSLTSITIPDSVTSIEYGAFSYCTSLTSITLPDSLTTIGGDTVGAFHGCTSLTSITIPDSVTSIGRGAFASCTALTSLTIPDKVTTIKDYAFYNCSKAIITIKQTDITKITSVSSTAFNNVKQIKVPSGSLSNYKTTAPWSNWASKIVGY